MVWNDISSYRRATWLPPLGDDRETKLSILPSVLAALRCARPDGSAAANLDVYTKPWRHLLSEWAVLFCLLPGRGSASLRDMNILVCE